MSQSVALGSWGPSDRELDQQEGCGLHAGHLGDQDLLDVVAPAAERIAQRDAGDCGVKVGAAPRAGPVRRPPRAGGAGGARAQCPGDRGGQAGRARKTPSTPGRVSGMPSAAAMRVAVSTTGLGLPAADSDLQSTSWMLDAIAARSETACACPRRKGALAGLRARLDHRATTAAAEAPSGPQVPWGSWLRSGSRRYARTGVTQGRVMPIK